MYRLLKIPARLALKLYCRNLVINNRSPLNSRGPLLIAANHPNSFLDAILIATLFNQPVYSLARGDVFTNRFTRFLLRSLNILPVYRLSEGAENVGHNYSTFEACREIFKKNGIVLIFSEGRCINEWKLRPLMKGTARLAISSWEEGINLTVLPTGINYHSFTRFGKHIHLFFGTAFNKKDVRFNNGYGKTIQDFNLLLSKELKQLVIEIDEDDHTGRKKIFSQPAAPASRYLLALPGIIGWMIHAPLYYPIKWFTHLKAAGTGHYDSIIVGLLFILYPFYLILCTTAVYLLTCSYWSLLSLALFPLTAWCLLQWRERF